MTEKKLVNFRLQPHEYEGLKILAELTGVTQVDFIRNLISRELEKQKEAIEIYKKNLKEAQDKIKK